MRRRISSIKSRWSETILTVVDSLEEFAREESESYGTDLDDAIRKEVDDLTKYSDTWSYAFPPESEGGAYGEGIRPLIGEGTPEEVQRFAKELNIRVPDRELAREAGASAYGGGRFDTKRGWDWWETYVMPKFESDVIKEFRSRGYPV